jgi:adenylate cyclase
VSDRQAGDFNEQLVHFDDGAWADAAAVFDRMRGKVLIAVTNVGAALMMLVGMVFGGGLRSDKLGPADAAIIVIALVAIAVSVLVVHFRATRRVSRTLGWLRARRSATAAEQHGILLWPWSTAVDVFGAWSAVSLLLGATAAILRYPTLSVVRIAVVGSLAGCGAAVLTFLLLEEICRPVLRLALAGQAAPGGSRLGLRLRLMLLWGLSSALPISVLGTAWLGLPAEGRSWLPVALGVNAALGLIFGLVGTFAVAHSLIEPVIAVRAAQRQVEDGDLEVGIPVDYGGEIGELQAGFNHMVAGLRERQRLQDIFGRYVGIEVARAALATGVRLGGERRFASVLFMDLIDSTAMTQRLQPEAVVALLNEIFTVVVRCVSTEGGWVNKFVGDAAMCVFGPPAGDAGGDAAAALRSARALRDALIAMGVRNPGLDAGIGVSAGEVVAGNIGAADRCEYTVIGDAVNEAARLTEQAKTVPGRLLASHAAVAAAADEGRWWRPHQSMLLRGRASATETYIPLQPVEFIAGDSPMALGSQTQALPAISRAAESPLQQGVPSARGFPEPRRRRD